jgi:hypothetical protein
MMERVNLHLVFRRTGDRDQPVGKAEFWRIAQEKTRPAGTRIF